MVCRLLLTLYYLMLSTPGVWKYAGVLAISAVLILAGKPVIQKRGLLIALPVCFYIFLGCLLFCSSDMFLLYLIKQFVFFLTPLAGALVLYAYAEGRQIYGMEDFMDIQLFAIIVTFVLRQMPDFTPGNLLESHYAFILGAYVIYYLYIKKYPYFFVSLFFMFLGNKRIAVFSMIFSSSLLCIRYFSPKCRNILLKLLTLGEIAVLYCYLFFCSSPAFSNLRIRLDHMFSGRMKAWEQVRDVYSFQPFYIGKGTGWVLGLLNELKIPRFENLHNDVLSIYIELGFVGFGLWACLTFLIVFYARGKHKICIFALLTYTMINLCTDNISIYIGYLMPYYMMILSVLNDKVPKGRHNEQKRNNKADGKTGFFAE